MNIKNRQKLIREILDSDKNINSRVANIQRQKLLGVVEDVNPYIQINQEDISKMKLYASTLRQVLEKRYLLTNNFLSDDTLPNINKYIVELGQTEDVIAAYNNVVSVYLNPRNTQETKTYIQKILIAFDEVVRNIAINVFEIIGRIKISRKQEHINLMIYAITLYKIILEQMNKATFHIITNTDMKHDFSINLEQYNAGKLEVEPIKSQFDIAENDSLIDPEEDIYSRYSDDDAYEIKDRDLRVDPEEDIYSRYSDDDARPLTRGYTLPSERDIEESRARVSRLGKPFEMTPSRSTYGMDNLMQTPQRVKSHYEAKPPSEPSSHVGSDEREPEDEEEPREKDETVPQASNVTEYFTTSKRITTEVIIDALREYNKKHPDAPINIPAQARGEYDYVYRTNLNSLRKAHNIEIYIATTPIAVPPSHDYDKLLYTLKKDAIYQSGDNKGYVKLHTLMAAINQYEAEKHAKIDYPPEVIKKVKTFYNYLTQYITFVNEDGEDYNPAIEGSGRHKKEMIPSTEPAMQFNDVKNDPYFVIQ